jgi:glycosyltransferase involved in cell wall biosynthesis
MKILIISRTTWDDSNSFGNTFSNIFGGMGDVELYNISCRNGISNNSVTAKELQMTDKSVLKSILNPFYDPCWHPEKVRNNHSANSAISVSAIKRRRTVSFIIRDLIWKLGGWKRSKTLKKFLEENKPDIVYLPIYSSPYMCDIQQYIVKKMGVPAVGHISDDEYNVPPDLSLFARLYRKHTQKKVAKIIRSCKYLEVFAQNMADEYSRIFNIPCYLIGKGVTQDEIDSIPDYKPKSNGKLKITYTGNISAERYSVLYMLGKAIHDSFTDKAYMEIYTQTQLSDQMKAGFDEIKDSVYLKGAVSSQEVRKIQQESDILLHIEGFSKKSLYEVRMSFSTKLIDYMLTGVPILAIGPEAANSMLVLKNNGLATVITDPDNMSEALSDLFSYNSDVFNNREGAKRYLQENRLINNIQSGIYGRFHSLIE